MTRQPPPDIGHFIRDWRQFRGMTMKELAEGAGVTVSLVSQLERGKASFVQLTLQRIAQALDVEPFMLLAAPPAEFGITLFMDRLESLGLDLDIEVAKRLLAFFEARGPVTAGFLLAKAVEDAKIKPRDPAARR